MEVDIYSHASNSVMLGGLIISQVVMRCSFQTNVKENICKDAITSTIFDSTTFAC